MRLFRAIERLDQAEIKLSESDIKRSEEHDHLIYDETIKLYYKEG